MLFTEPMVPCNSEVVSHPITVLELIFVTYTGPLYELDAVPTGRITTMLISFTSLSPSNIETLSEITNMPVEEI